MLCVPQKPCTQLASTGSSILSFRRSAEDPT